MTRPDWLDNTTAYDSVHLDIGFIVVESFYFGGENDIKQIGNPKLREELYQPKVERFGGYVFSVPLQAQIDEMVKYYKDVIRLASKHKKDVANQYFWLRPAVYRRDEFVVSFPWYDTWEESTAFLDRLESAGDGEIFWDCDQCWELSIIGDGNDVYIREWDPDNQEEHVAISCPRDQLCDQVDAVRRRTDGIIDELRRALGRDYWTTRF